MSIISTTTSITNLILDFEVKKEDVHEKLD